VRSVLGRGRLMRMGHAGKDMQLQRWGFDSAA